MKADEEVAADYCYTQITTGDDDNDSQVLLWSKKFLASRVWDSVRFFEPIRGRMTSLSPSAAAAAVPLCPRAAAEDSNKGSLVGAKSHSDVILVVILDLLMPVRHLASTWLIPSPGGPNRQPEESMNDVTEQQPLIFKLFF